MLTHDAPAVAGTTARGHSTGNTASIAELHLPQHVLDVLADEGVHDLDDWRRLGRKRHRLFGVTRAMVRRLDAMAREASR